MARRKKPSGRQIIARDKREERREERKIDLSFRSILMWIVILSLILAAYLNLITYLQGAMRDAGRDDPVVLQFNLGQLPAPPGERPFSANTTLSSRVRVTIT